MFFFILLFFITITRVVSSDVQLVYSKREFVVIFDCIVCVSNVELELKCIHCSFICIRSTETLILWYYLLSQYLFSVVFFPFFCETHAEMLLLHHDISFLVFYNLFICFIFSHVTVFPSCLQKKNVK